MKRYFNSTYILYFSFFVMLFMMLFMISIQVEKIEVSFIRQILHPEYTKGAISYNPFYHYDYIVAFAAKWLGCKDNFQGLAKLFWFLETALAILVLIKLCNFIFKNDKMILVMAFMILILFSALFNGGTIDQKTMLRPFYFLAIYFFLKEKWLISALFGAFLFYLHVGVALWWLLPSLFAVSVIFLIHKRISLKQMINYSLTVIILASPIICFYLWRIQTSEIDEFLIKYYYYNSTDASSIIWVLRKPISFISTLLMIGVFLIGYNKARKSRYKTDNIMPIAIGALIVFILAFIFVDILGYASAIILKLTRSILLNTELFSSLFLAFLFARQIKKGNYIFFLIFVLVFFYYHSIWWRVFGYENFGTVLVVFYSLVLIYEIFERYILNLTGKMYKVLEKRLTIPHFKDIRLLRRPAVISVFLILVIIPKFPILKSHIKSVLGLQQSSYPIMLETAQEYLYNDIARFTNEKITDAFLLIPFLESDFNYYIKHKTFIDSNTPINTIQYKNKPFNFKHILENDLGFPAERLFKNHGKDMTKIWGGLWKDLNEDTIRHLKKKYGITHVVREKDLPLNFPVLYQNRYYVVYEIK